MLEPPFVTTSRNISSASKDVKSFLKVAERHHAFTVSDAVIAATGGLPKKTSAGLRPSAALGTSCGCDDAESLVVASAPSHSGRTHDPDGAPALERRNGVDHPPQPANTLGPVEAAVVQLGVIELGRLRRSPTGSKGSPDAVPGGAHPSGRARG